MEKVMILPFGCNYQLAYCEKIEVIGITGDPYTYNKCKSLPPSFISEVEDIIGFKSGEVKKYKLTLCLVSDGVVVQCTSGDIREINNRFISYYNSVMVLSQMCGEYGLDDSPITETLKMSYTETAIQLVEKYIKLFSEQSTFNNKSVIREAKSLREKVLTLHAIFNKDILSTLHFVGEKDTDVYLRMALDFAMLDSIRDGEYALTGWQCIQREMDLFHYFSPRGKTQDVANLSAYIIRILNNMLVGLIEYKDGNGLVNQNIISFDAGKVFYDIDKKCSFRDLR